MSRLWWSRGIGAAAVALAMGCHDGGLPTDASGPDAVVVGASRADAPTRVVVLPRTRPLERNLTASARIGRAGGTIDLANGAVRLTIPRGAVQASTDIGVTLVAGSGVAIEFQPRGLQFDRPLTVDVSLAGTHAATDPVVAAPLVAAYGPEGGSGLLSNGTANVSEVERVALGFHPSTARFQITHFTGYILATGRVGR